MSLPDLAGGGGAAVSLVLGLIFGSFANVCIHRIPRGESVVTPRSRCPGCGTLIPWHDNIPVLSWLLLSGRCRGCAMAISWVYPAVEALMGAGFLACYLVFGPGLEAVAAAWLFFTLVVLWVIDSREFILPDALTLTGLAAGVLFAVIRGALRLPGAGESTARDIFLGGALDRPPLLLASLAGALAGAAIPFLARSGYMLIRRLRGGVEPEEEPAGEEDLSRAAVEEGMGLGDVKMLAMVGAFLGPRPVLVTILAGSITGCLVVIPWLMITRRGFRTPIPFGPFLAFGALVALFVGEPLADGYSRLILRLMG